MTATEQLVRLHQEMRKEMILCGIQDGVYDFVIKKIEKKTEEQVYSLLGFFHNLYNTHYKDLLKVRAYRPEDFWINMRFFFSQRKLHEQKLLAQEQKRIRRAWKRYFGEVTENGEETEQDRPEKSPTRRVV